MTKTLKIAFTLDPIAFSDATIAHQMPRTIVRLLAAAIVSGTLVLAQAPEYTLKVDVPFISVDVTVRDSNARPVDGLAADAFAVYENGVRQELTHFFPVSTPYNVLLLFDRSGSTQDKWLLIFLYSFQIYADFFGYSAIAVGLALLFGYRLPINFNLPYASTTFAEFWTRWHISLSSWLRTY